MPAPRKPAGEKHVNRWISLRPWVDEFMTTKKTGERSAWLNDLVEASQEFRAWWDAIRLAEEKEIRSEEIIRFERIDAEEVE